MSKQINIGGRIHSTEVGNVSVGANEVLDDTKGKKQNVINSETDAELLRLDQSKQNNLTFDNTPTENSNNPVKSSGVYAADKALSDAIEAILLLIPSAATALNQLADKAFVNSSVSTATATFRGTYNVVTDLELAYDATHEQIATKLGQVIATADNNDYAFVQVPVSATSTDIRRTERYKFNGTVWGYEYDLNTSGFTAVQWEAINSGITALLVSKLTNLPTAEVLATMFDDKQNVLTFDTEPTALSSNPVTSGGIYLAIQAVATALSDYETATDALIPSEATALNQLADKAYVLASILAATPAFKGQFTTLADLQAVVSPKAGDLGIVRTKDNDGKDVFTFYQYLSNAWNVYFSLSYHPQTKPATTGTTGDYPYNGMGRVELPMNIVEGVNTLTQSMMPTATGGNTIYVIKYDFVLTEDITLGSGCVLLFEGGSISSGGVNANTLTGNKTNIVSNNKCFDSALVFAGTWHLQTVFVDWFVGATVNVDCTAAITKAVALAKLARTSLTFGGNGDTDTKYYCTGGGIDVSYLTIYGNGSLIGFIGDCEGFLADGNLTVKDLTVSKFPYQHETTENGQNKAFNITGNHTYIFDNVSIDGFRVGWYLNAAWNVRIDKCGTHRCYYGVELNGLSVNNNISNSRIDANGICIYAHGGTAGEGFMITNNLISSADTGIKLENFDVTIIKNNIIDLISTYGIELVQNCQGTVLEGNYIGMQANSARAVEAYAQNISNDEDLMYSIKNNIIKYYGVIKSGIVIRFIEGTYRLISICGNHIHGAGVDKGVISTATVNTIYVRDNLIEYTDDEYGITISNATNVFNADNVVIQTQS